MHTGRARGAARVRRTPNEQHESSGPPARGPSRDRARPGRAGPGRRPVGAERRGDPGRGAPGGDPPARPARGPRAGAGRRPARLLARLRAERLAGGGGPMTTTAGRGAPRRPETAREAAEVYLALGLAAIPGHPRSKRPVGDGWQDQRPRPEDLDRPVPPGAARNVGVLNGVASGGLADADLDVVEAARAAPHFLPPTNWRFGRPSKPGSHWLYRTEPAPPRDTEQFTDPTSGDVLLELRGGS